MKKVKKEKKCREQLKNLAAYSLSSRDLMRFVGSRANMVTYPEIAKYQTLDDLLGPYKAAIILYLTSKNYGHWCLIFREGNVVYFFDSYGLMPDRELKWLKGNPILSDYPRNPLNRLSKLLKESPYEIDYNNHKLQNSSHDIATCGRHVGMRLLMRKLDNEQYYRLMKGQKGITSDQIVTYLSHLLSGI